MGILSVIILAPLAAAGALLLIPGFSKGAIRLVSLLGALVTLFCSIYVACAYDMSAGGIQFREHVDILPSLGIADTSTRYAP